MNHWYPRITLIGLLQSLGIFSVLLPLTLTGCHPRGNETISMPPPMAGVSNLFVGPTAELGRHESLRPEDVHLAPTGNTLTMPFDKAQLSAQLPTDANIQTWTGSIRLTLDPVLSKEVKTLRTHFRYSLTKDEGTRAFLLFDVDGKYLVDEYDFAQKVDGDKIKEIEVAYGNRPHQATSIHIHMILERRNQNSNALLMLDAMDIWGITGKEEFPK